MNGPILLLALAGLTRSFPAIAACDLPALEDTAVTVGIVAHGHQIGGMGIVTLTPAASTPSERAPSGPTPNAAAER